MDINEAAPRLLRRYWLLVLVTIGVPLIAVAVYVLREPATYTATARLLVAPAPPKSRAESEALVSQVQALATSRDLVTRSLADAKAGRDPRAAAAAVSVTGLGTSATVDLAYTDRDPAVAHRVTEALATALIGQLDANQAGRLPEAIADLDTRIAALSATRDQQANAAAARPLDRTAQNRLAGTERELAGMLAARTQLAENLAALGGSRVMAPPVPPAAPDPRGLAAKLGIAGLLGVALSLIVMSLNEALRPRVAGAAGAARVLDAPVLGEVGTDRAALAEAGRRIRLAGTRAGIRTVVLASASASQLPYELVDRVADAVLHPHPAAGHLPAPAEPRPQPGFDSGEAPTGGHGIAVLARTHNVAPQPRPRPRYVCGLDEIDAGDHTDRAGLVIVVGREVSGRDLRLVRDLLAAAGWPLLGVLAAESRPGGTR